MTALIQHAPFLRICLEALAVRGKSLDSEIAHATLEALADLTADLAEAWPPQVEPRQRPLQKGYAIAIFHEPVAREDHSDCTLTLPMNDAQQFRVFVGIKISAEVARELARLARALEGASVGLVPAGDIHVTLVPPWNETCVPAAIGKLRKALDGFAGFLLTFERLRYGPTTARPRLLWAESANTPELVRLWVLLLRTFEQTDDRPFRPHATLARIRKNGPAITRRNPLSTRLSLAQQVTAIELFQSPRPGESGYKVLASLPLERATQPAPVTADEASD